MTCDCISQMHTYITYSSSFSSRELEEKNKIMKHPYDLVETDRELIRSETSLSKNLSILKNVSSCVPCVCEWSSFSYNGSFLRTESASVLHPSFTSQPTSSSSRGWQLNREFKVQPSERVDTPASPGLGLAGANFDSIPNKKSKGQITMMMDHIPWS